MQTENQLLLDHTQWIGGNGLNLKGVRGLADAATSAGSLLDIDWSNPQTAGAAVNSEALYLTNLIRSAQGLPPVDPSTAAPSVNVGLSPDLKNALLLGGAGILAVVLISGRRKRK